MAAVNVESMASNLPLDFFPMHSRSTSVSSSSSVSPRSRPHSSQGHMMRIPVSLAPSSEDFYSPSFANLDHGRHNSDTSHSSAYSLGSTDIITPADSPPNHNVANPGLKAHLRTTHIRARAAASPYPRDAESVHSSSSETEDLTMFLGHQSDYHSSFANGPAGAPSQQSMHVPGAFGSGRMPPGTDHTLEKLAANVRAATTTSASDRAKQIFVQAWWECALLFVSHPSELTSSSSTQVDFELRPIPRWQCTSTGPLLLLSASLRPVRDTPHKYSDFGKSHKTLFSYNQNSTPGRPRK
jgi:regulatory factor X